MDCSSPTQGWSVELVVSLSMTFLRLYCFVLIGKGKFVKKTVILIFLDWRKASQAWKRVENLKILATHSKLDSLTILCTYFGIVLQCFVMSNVVQLSFINMGFIVYLQQWNIRNERDYLLKKEHFPIAVQFLHEFHCSISSSHVEWYRMKDTTACNCIMPFGKSCFEFY
jgi:hypothetical protein